jgi:hypothetical protein
MSKIGLLLGEMSRPGLISISFQTAFHHPFFTGQAKFSCFSKTCLEEIG